MDISWKIITILRPIRITINLARIFLFLTTITKYKILLHSGGHVSTADRSPLPEQNAPKAQEAAHEFHPVADSRAREAVPQAEVPGISRASRARQVSQDDRRTGQDVVSKSTHQVEVNKLFYILNYQNCSTSWEKNVFFKGTIFNMKQFSLCSMLKIENFFLVFKNLEVWDLKVKSRFMYINKNFDSRKQKQKLFTLKVARLYWKFLKVRGPADKVSDGHRFIRN